MPISDVVLQGMEVRLEPVAHNHIDGLVLAAAVDPSLYVWSPVPQGAASASQYVETALAWRNAGTAVPFAIIRLADNAVVGCTRFWNLERWTWPRDHPRYGRKSKVVYAGTALSWAVYGPGNGWRQDTGDFVGTIRALLEAGATIPPGAEELEPSEAVLEMLP
jgi:hypothetical protein